MFVFVVAGISVFDQSKKKNNNKKNLQDERTIKKHFKSHLPTIHTNCLFIYLYTITPHV